MKTINVKSLGETPYLISLQPQHLIGQGSYSQVRLAYNKHNPAERLAAKIFDLGEVKQLESAFRELGIVCSLPSCDHLVEYRKVKITSRRRLYVLMELCRGSLREVVGGRQRDGGCWAEGEVWDFVRQIVEGYSVLRKRSIIHRDIKPDNILIGYDKTYKISDFGLSQIITQIEKSNPTHCPTHPPTQAYTSSRVKGSLFYLAPQLLLHYQLDKYKNTDINDYVNEMNDVYSFGVTVFEACFGRLPYVRDIREVGTLAGFVREVKNNGLKFPHNDYSEQLISLISSMLQKQPSKRCSWQYILHTTANQIPLNPTLQPPIPKSEPPTTLTLTPKKFRIIQISDTFLKNLSTLDTDLYKQLSNESLAVVDHVEAEIVARRQIVFFCDRLQYRLEIIGGKEGNGRFGVFCGYLLQYAYCLAMALYEKFQSYYQKIQRNQFLKLITTQKYTKLKSLITHDYQSLKQSLLPPLPQSPNSPTQPPPLLQSLQTQIYTLCYDLILELYTTGHYDQCMEVDQLEKWLFEGERGSGVLAALRRNQGALGEFYRRIAAVGRDGLRLGISRGYIYQFNRIDKQKDRSNIICMT